MSNRRRDRSSLCSEPSLFTTTRSAAEYSERAENQHCYEGTHPEITRFRCDCLGERSQFEPPRPFTDSPTKFCPSVAHYSARKGASVIERTCCLGFGSSWISPVP